MGITPISQWGCSLTPIRCAPSSLKAYMAALVCGFQCACAPIPVSTTEHQTELGKVAIVSATVSPTITLKGYAGGKGEGAAVGSLEGIVSCMQPGFYAGPLAPLIFIVCLPFGAVGGAAVGGVDAQGTEEVQTSEKTVVTAMHTDAMQEALREQVELAALRNGTSVVAVTPASLESLRRDKDYRLLSSAGVDTALEVGMTKVGTAGGGINPPLSLEMEAHVRLVRTIDNTEIMSSHYTHSCGNLKLAEWAANQGEQMVVALKSEYEILGGHIYDDIFLLYPFPDQKRHQESFWRERYTWGLAAIYPPSDNIRNAKDIEELQPTLRWQAFPRETDIAVAPEDMKKVDNVRYDLILAKEKNFAPLQISYRRDNLTTPTHRIESSLDPQSGYFWAVRARFTLDGRERVTEWSATFNPNINFSEVELKHNARASPSRYSYAFRTP